MACVLAASLGGSPSLAVERVHDAGDDGRAEAELADWLAAKLADDGIDVVADAEDADAVLRLDHDNGVLTVETQHERFVIEPGPPAVVRLEVLHRAHQAVEAARRASARARADASRDTSARPPLARPTANVDTVTEPVALRRRGVHPLHGSRPEFRLGVEAGLVVRRRPDAAVRATMRAGSSPGLGGRLDVAVIPSAAESVQVLDTILGAGVDVDLALGRRFMLTLAGVLGARIHSFRHGSGRGAQGDVYAAMPIDLAWRVTDRTRLQLGVRAAVAGEPTAHGYEIEQGVETVAWSTTAWSVGMGLGVSHGWWIR